MNYKIFVLLILAFICKHTQAQDNGNLSGKIFDKSNNQPLDGVSIFLDNTTIGTTSDSSGKILINQIPFGNYTLVISKMGYKIITKKIEIKKNLNELTVQLIPEIIKLDEVIVKPDPYRKNYIALFYNAFIGDMSLSEQCKILNTSALVFHPNTDENTLTVRTNGILLVENKILGYKLHVKLDSLKINFNLRKTTYKASVFLEEMYGEASQKKRWEKNRKRAYLGSIRHFYRSLYNNNLSDNGFKILAVDLIRDQSRLPDSIIDSKIKSLMTHDGNRADLMYWKRQRLRPVMKYRITDSLISSKNLIRFTGDSGIGEFHFDKYVYVVSNNKLIETRYGKTSVGTILILNEPYALIDNQGTLLNSNSIFYEGDSIEKLVDKLPINYSVEDRSSPTEEKLKSFASINKVAELPANEKIFIHTDKDFYTVGESCRLKLYLMLGSDRSLSSKSRIAYIDLLDSNLNVNHHFTIPLKGGLGGGIIYLSDTLKSGMYLVRSYTNWMRNFGEETFFVKKIYLVNENVLNLSKTDYTNLNKRPIQSGKRTVTSEPIIRFYPEGGQLYHSLHSNVYFNCQDNNGIPIKISGQICKSDGQVLCTFQANEDGIGKFQLLPDRRENYFAVGLSRTGQSFKIALPSTKSMGAILEVSQNDSLVLVKIVTNDELRAINPRMKLSVSSPSSRPFDLPVFSDKSVEVYSLSKSKFRSGITQFELLDDKNNSIASHLYYISNRYQLSLSSIKDSITHPKNDSLTIKLDLKLGQQQLKESAYLSMAVIDSPIRVPEEGIFTYLNLQSHFPSQIVEKQEYLNEADLGKSERLQEFLIVNRDQLTDKALDKVQRNEFAPETDISISGKLSDLSDKPSAVNLNVTLYMPQAQGQKLFSAKTDDHSRFIFNNIEAYGKQQVKITAIDIRGKKIGQIHLDTNLLINPIPVSKSRYNSYFQFDKTWEMSKQFFGSLQKNAIKLQEVVVKSKMGFAAIQKDSLFIISKSDEQFYSLFDFMLAKLPGAIRWKIIPEVLAFTVASGTTGPAYVQRLPEIKVVGVPSRLNFQQIYDLKMSEVISVRIIKGRDGHRGMGENVLVYLTVRPNAFTGSSDNPLQFEISTFLESSFKYNTIFSIKNNSSVSKNKTIYWNGDLRLTDDGVAEISIKKSLLKKSQYIFIEGVTKTGIPISCTYPIKNIFNLD